MSSIEKYNTEIKTHSEKARIITLSNLTLIFSAVLNKKIQYRNTKKKTHSDKARINTTNKKCFIEYTVS